MYVRSLTNPASNCGGSALPLDILSRQGVILGESSALQGLTGMLVHFGEVLNPGQTDHLRLAGKLAQGATRGFHYYRVIETK